jgi:DNA-binding Lrp family transcriptional regulator
MSEEGVPDDVRSFLHEYIDSVVQLELLILLCDEKPRTVEAVAKALRIEPGWTLEGLEKLSARGLISVTGATYHHGPSTPELEQSIRRAIEAYGQRRVSVVSLIYSRPSDPIRSFAEAFRVRKD